LDGVAVQNFELIHAVGKLGTISQCVTMQNPRKMERIVFLERNTFTIDFGRPNFEHEWLEYGDTSLEEIVPRLSDATIVICNKLPLRESSLKHLPTLKLIAVAATGVDNIDLTYCKVKGIAVCNTRGYAINSLPEHALMLMLALRRNLVAYVDDVKQDRWSNARQFCLLDYPIGDLRGATLGIVGYGTLGKAMERLARAVGMKVLIADHKHAREVRNGRVAFEEALRSSDVISLHCPLTDDTRNLIGAQELALMKPQAVLVNTARGGLIDDEALVRALAQGELGGAGLDVLRVEPPRQPNTLLEARLPNLIITPHNAWASQQAMQTLADQLIENIEAFVRGEPRSLVVS
jgi:glycerate dehydrogenase